jgi:CRISPR-associated protein Cmr6
VRIVVNGKDIPKKDLEVQRKAEQAQKREQEEIAQKEKEKQEREQRRQPILNNQNQGNMPLNDSFNRAKMRVPRDVRNLTNLNGIDNFALKLYKGARFEERADKFYFFNSKPIKKKVDGVSTTLVDAFEIQHKDYGLGEKINQIAQQHEKSAKNLFNTEGCLKHQNFKPDWRVVVGLGTDSVYETGITLHHIYGFPYIPASAIKGITNHYALDMLKDENQEDNNNLGEYKVTKPLYDEIFGTTKQQGKITFFDAMPISIPQLKPDIMNVHYPDYYGGGSSAPTDTQSPRPILFLTVHETSFQFMLGCKEDDKKYLSVAFDWLKKALTEKGIGAKTAVGYGYMQ